MAATDIGLTAQSLIPALRGEGLLFQDPRPLIFSDRPVVVDWSPKSACTHALIWYLAQEGLVRGAEFFDPWPHRYRGQVYYRSMMYRQAATRFLNSGGRGYTLLRITRAPARRFVSIFRHVARTGLLGSAMSAALGRDTSETGFSIREMGRYLEGRDLVVPSEENFHLCAQYHPVWDMAFDRVITLNVDETALETGLGDIERDLQLPGRRVADNPWFHSVRSRHYARNVPHEGNGAVEDRRFGSASGANFPKSALEESEVVRDLAARLHGIDLGRVGTSDTAGRLFQGSSERK